MTCPKCGYEDWRLVSLLYAQGITHTSQYTSSNINAWTFGLDGSIDIEPVDTLQEETVELPFPEQRIVRDAEGRYRLINLYEPTLPKLAQELADTEIDFTSKETLEENLEEIIDNAVEEVSVELRPVEPNIPKRRYKPEQIANNRSRIVLNKRTKKQRSGNEHPNN